MTVKPWTDGAIQLYPPRTREVAEITAKNFGYGTVANAFCQPLVAQSFGEYAVLWRSYGGLYRFQDRLASRHLPCRSRQWSSDRKLAHSMTMKAAWARRKGKRQ